MYLWQFLYVKNLYSFSRIFLWARSIHEHFTSVFLQTWNWMPSCFNNFWKVEPRNTLLLSVRTKMGRRFRGFIYLSSFKTVSNASLTALPVIDFNGKISKYFEKTITIRRYLWLSLCLVRDWTSTKSDSQTSKTLETVYGFLGIRFRTGLWRVCASFCSSHGFSSLGLAPGNVLA